MSSKIPITVVVPIKNEADNLPHCLSRLGDFEEVLVVDSGSSDNSMEIARQYGATVLAFQWDGHFPKKRNWVLRHYSFRTPWVLFLDADEQVTPEFVNEVNAVIRETSCDGFWITYPKYFLNRLLRHGDQLSKLALIRLGCGEYERIEEDAWSALDMEVHEHLLVQGEVGRIRSPIIHYDFKNLHAYYDRHNQYSSWEAARYLTLSRDDYATMNWRQRIKYRLLDSGWFPVTYFVGSYILNGGFLDGRAGFHYAASKTFYFLQVNFKIKEKRAGKITNPDVTNPDLQLLDTSHSSQ